MAFARLKRPIPSCPPRNDVFDVQSARDLGNTISTMNPVPQPSPSPAPKHEPKPEPDPNPLPRIRKALLGVGAAVAITAAAFFLSRPAGDTQEPPEQVQQEMVAFSHMTADLPLVNVENPEERAKAKAALPMSAEEAEEMIKQAQSGQIRLVWVVVWDNHDEDGDSVQISSGGVTTPTIVLAHAKRTVVMPVTPGESIQIIGVRDGGGGGITTGIVTSSGPISVPPLTPGQVVNLRVR